MLAVNVQHYYSIHCKSNKIDVKLFKGVFGTIRRKKYRRICS